MKNDLNVSNKFVRILYLFQKMPNLDPNYPHLTLRHWLHFFGFFLLYGILVWGLAYDTHTKPIYLLQKKVVRAIAFKNFTSPSTPIFSELKILKLYDLSILKLLTFVYESVNLISPAFFYNFFETLPSVHQKDTRQACRGDIFVMRKNTLQCGLRSIRYAGAKVLNDIPSKIKQSPSIVILRREMNIVIVQPSFTLIIQIK